LGLLNGGRLRRYGALRLLLLYGLLLRYAAPQLVLRAEPGLCLCLEARTINPRVQICSLPVDGDDIRLDPSVAAVENRDPIIERRNSLAIEHGKTDLADQLLGRMSGCIGIEAVAKLAALKRRIELGVVLAGP